MLDQQARTGSQLRSQGFQQAQPSTTSGKSTIKTSTTYWSVGQLGVGNLEHQLGQLGQQMNVQDINTLLGIGGLQQGQQQRELDVARANLLAQQALPFQQSWFLV